MELIISDELELLQGLSLSCLRAILRNTITIFPSMQVYIFLFYTISFFC
jgi:hypothetical protein